MKEQIRIWLGAIVTAVIYLTMCGMLDAHDQKMECSTVRCS